MYGSLPSTTTTRLICAAVMAGVLALLSTLQPVRAQSAETAQLHLRIDQLETQLRDMTGQVEQLNHQVRQLEDQLRRLSEDTEFRFREMGSGGRSSATVSSARPSNTPPPQANRGFEARPLAPPPGAGSSNRGDPPSNLGALPAPLNISPFGNGSDGRTDAGALFGNNNAGNASGNTIQNPAQASLGVATDPQGAYDVAYAYILQRDYDGAEFAFRQFLQDNPQHALSGNAQYWLGESHFARKQFREAADAFLKGYTEYKSSPKAPDSLLKLGMSLKALNQKDAACSSLSELERRFPRAPREVKERARAELRSARC